ncbi:hypothetical protein [Minisyncoccus archaeiphilus]
MIEPVPSGFLMGSRLNDGEVEPPVVVLPPILGGLEDAPGV